MLEENSNTALEEDKPFVHTKCDDEEETIVDSEDSIRVEEIKRKILSSDIRQSRKVDVTLLDKLEECERKLSLVRGSYDIFECGKISMIDAIIVLSPDAFEAYSKTLQEAQKSLQYLINNDISGVKNEIEAIIDSCTTDKAVSKPYKDTLEDIRIKCKGLSTTAAALGTEIREAMDLLVKIETCRDRRNPLSIYIATWNLGNRAPKSNELEKLLMPDGEMVDTDIIAIGTQESNYKLTQEMRDLSGRGYSAKKEGKAALLKLRSLSGSNMNNQDLTFALRSHKHRVKLENNLKRAIYNNSTESAGYHFVFILSNLLGCEYALIREAELFEMRLFIFIKKPHIGYTTDVVYTSESTGVGGIYANKGGVGICLVMDGIKFCFISCHLAAHRKSVSQRNGNLIHIFQSFKKRLGNRGYELQSEFDHVFVFGDLNYRLDISKNELDQKETPETSAESGTNQFRIEEDKRADGTKDEWNTILKLASKTNWKETREVDQLWHQRTAGRALTSFEEGDYNFLPTFKVERNMPGNIYVENRIPSYCDRILWYSIPTRKSMLQLATLNSYEEASTSDHKPVFAKFNVQRKVLPALEEEDGNIFETKYPEVKAFKEFVTSFFARKKKPKSADTGFQIRIIDLEAVNLKASDIDGTSDPYVVFCSPTLFPPKSEGSLPMRGVAQTAVLRNRLNAKWKDSQIPSFRLPEELSTIDALRGRYLVLALWDKDQLSRDDPIGQAVLDLTPVIECYENDGSESESLQHTVGRFHHFELPVILDGRTCGKISGKIQLLGEKVNISQLASLRRSDLHRIKIIPCCF